MELQKDSSTMLVRDMMVVGVPVCSLSTGIVEVSEIILQTNYEAVVVLDENGHAQGYISQDDLIRGYAKGISQETNAESIMQSDIPEVPADIPIEAAVKIMIDQHRRILFITHHSGGIKYPAGMLSYRQILLFIAHHDPGELGVQAKRKSPMEMFQERRDAARKKNLEK